MKVAVQGNTRIFAVHPHAMEPYMGTFGKYLTEVNGFDGNISADGPVEQILEDQDERIGVKFFTVEGEKKTDVKQLSRDEVFPDANLSVGNGNSSARTASEVTGVVMVLPIRGVMIKYSYGYYYRVVGTQEMIKNIDAANANPSIVAILLDIDSPGGMVDGNYLLSESVGNSKKPVYAYVNGLCASAAYQVASQCREIWTSSPTDFVGSIGVFQVHVSYEKALDEIGIKYTYIVADGGDDKVVAPWTKDLSAEDEKKIKNEVNPLRTIMVDHIRSGRGNRLKPDERTFRGGIFTTSDAKKQGLIEGRNTFSGVLLRAFKAGQKEQRDRNNSSETIIENKAAKTDNVSTQLNQKPIMSTFKQTLGKALGIKALEAPEFQGSVELNAEEQKAVFASTQQLKDENEQLKGKLSTVQAENKVLQDKIDSFESRMAALEAKGTATPAPAPEKKVEKVETVATDTTTEKKATEKGTDKTAALIAANAQVLAPKVDTPAATTEKSAEVLALEAKLAALEKEKATAIANYNELAETAGGALHVEAGDESGEGEAEGKKKQVTTNNVKESAHKELIGDLVAGMTWR